jgi:hypothetical protein
MAPPPDATADGMGMALTSQPLPCALVFGRVVRCEVSGAGPIGQFWGFVAPCEHLVEFYEDEGNFIDMLGRFVVDGLRGGEAVVAIANVAHLGTLRARIEDAGLDAALLQARGRYTPLDAAALLSRFMVGGWPDPQRFEQVIGPVLARARREGRAVRAFGEMVALLWGRGHHQATLALERLWSGLCVREQVAVLCAYPCIGATRDLADDRVESVAGICALHTQVRGLPATVEVHVPLAGQAAAVEETGVVGTEVAGTFGTLRAGRLPA